MGDKATCQDGSRPCSPGKASISQHDALWALGIDSGLMLHAPLGDAASRRSEMIPGRRKHPVCKGWLKGDLRKSQFSQAPHKLHSGGVKLSLLDNLAALAKKMTIQCKPGASLQNYGQTKSPHSSVLAQAGCKSD